MKPKPGTDPDELRRLIREQAVAFQSLYGWNPTSDQDPLWYPLRCQLLSAAYSAATNALKSKLDMPVWDEDRGILTDYPDLKPVWRIYPISQYPIFPPLVRVQAGRTILPDELPAQLEAWRHWVKQLIHGEHVEYLRELHCYATTDWAYYHWTCLHEAATGSLTATGKWASRPELVSLREEILHLPHPIVPKVRLLPTDKAPATDFTVIHTQCLSEARTLVGLTRRWDGLVRGNSKLRYYEDCYKLTLDQFRGWATDPWLHEFFAWAGRCVDLGFGFWLDY